MHLETSKIHVKLTVLDTKVSIAQRIYQNGRIKWPWLGMSRRASAVSSEVIVGWYKEEMLSQSGGQHSKQERSDCFLFILPLRPPPSLFLLTRPTVFYPRPHLAPPPLASATERTSDEEIQFVKRHYCVGDKVCQANEDASGMSKDCSTVKCYHPPVHFSLPRRLSHSLTSSFSIRLTNRPHSSTFP